MGISPESWPAPFQRMIRTNNKYLLNPVMLRLAGRRWWYASVLEHTGRRSGKHFKTPIVADRVGEHLIVPLPYGTQVDWIRNVMAAGEVTVVRKGVTYRVTSPAFSPHRWWLPRTLLRSSGS